VIFPETDLRPIADYPAGIRPWVLCQNHHYMFNQMAPGLSWEELGVEGVICTSRAIFAAVLQFSRPSPLSMSPASSIRRCSRPRRSCARSRSCRAR
jgi:hypothetical protein